MTHFRPGSSAKKGKRGIKRQVVNVSELASANKGLARILGYKRIISVEPGSVSFSRRTKGNKHFEKGFTRFSKRWYGKV